MPEEYNAERNAYFAHYYPFEIDPTLTFEERGAYMREWWTKHLELFIKHKLNIDVIDIIIQDSCLMDFRE